MIVRKTKSADSIDGPTPTKLANAASFRRKLLAWYAANARDLPWRRTHDPYAIWISEIMLQQTQVATVLDYYTRFLHRFPSVQSVAEADEEEVLRYWSGLGYYRRARQLHSAAKKVVECHNGKFPVELEAIGELPGIGRYTAGAIVSFATDGRAPIVEANTARLYARLMGLEEELAKPKSQRKLWDFAASVIPKQGNGTGLCNQALIELGSQVCTPQAPKCQLCPVQNHCAAFQQGIQHRIPPPKQKQQADQLVHAMVVIRYEDEVLLRQSEAGQWWQGLWEFARIDLTKREGRRRKIPAKTTARNTTILEPRELETALWDTHKIECPTPQFAGVFTHAVTRFRIRLECFAAEVPNRIDTSQLTGTWKWRPTAEVALPLSAPSQRVQSLLLK